MGSSARAFRYAAAHDKRVSSARGRGAAGSARGVSRHAARRVRARPVPPPLRRDMGGRRGRGRALEPAFSPVVGTPAMSWAPSSGAPSRSAESLLWLVGRWQRAAAESLFRDGVEVSGVVKEVFRDVRVRMNGRNPWRVVCEMRGRTAGRPGAPRSGTTRPHARDGRPACDCPLRSSEAFSQRPLDTPRRGRRPARAGGAGRRRRTEPRKIKGSRPDRGARRRAPGADRAADDDDEEASRRREKRCLQRPELSARRDETSPARSRGDDAYFPRSAFW